jgi:hypothetical protein
VEVHFTLDEPDPPAPPVRYVELWVPDADNHRHAVYPEEAQGRMDWDSTTAPNGYYHVWLIARDYEWELMDSASVLVLTVN